MRQDYLGTSYLDQKYLPSERILPCSEKLYFLCLYHSWSSVFVGISQIGFFPLRTPHLAAPLYWSLSVRSLMTSEILGGSPRPLSTEQHLHWHCYCFHLLYCLFHLPSLLCGQRRHDLRGLSTSTHGLQYYSEHQSPIQVLTRLNFSDLTGTGYHSAMC